MNNRHGNTLKNYSKRRPKIMNNRRENTLKNYSERSPRSRRKQSKIIQ